MVRHLIFIAEMILHFLVSFLLNMQEALRNRAAKN